MSRDRRLAELFELCEALCRDELTSAQQERLQQLVKSDEEQRRAYVRYLHMHVCLRRAYESGQPVTPVDEVPTPAVPETLPIQRQPRPSYLGLRSLAAASVLLMLGLAWSVFWFARPDGLEREDVATLTNASGCIWETTPAPVKGSRLPAGRLELNSGMAELTFRNGAVVVVEAPAVLELVDATRGYLHNGRIVVRVPKQAIGFVIETPKARVLDLGTEFGVGVGNSGDTLVQVFDGVVVADFKNAANRSVDKQRLIAGQTMQINADADALPEEIASVGQRFVRRMPPAKERGADTLVPYNRNRFDAMHVVPAVKPPTIDGDLADWDRSGAFFCPCEEPFSRDYYVEGMMMYDKDNLYIAAHVGDPAPMCSVIHPRTDPTVGWKGGAVQVRLSTDKNLGWPVDAGNHLSPKPRRPLLPQDNSPRLAHLTMWYCDPAKLPCLHIAYGMDFRKDATNPSGFRGAFRKDANGRGYTLEYAIPWRLLNAANDPPRGGDVLGCTWNVHWSDEEGRLWRGYLVDVLNPNEKGFTYVSAALTWGKAIFHAQGKLPPGAVAPR